LRIALVIERFQPQGGVEHVAWELAHRLSEAGDRVEVVARRVDPAATLPVRQVTTPSAWQPARVLGFSRAAARAAPRGSFDVVHSFSRTRHQDVYRAGGGCHAEYLARAHPGLPGRARRLSPRHAVLLALEARVFSDPTQLVQCSSLRVRDQIAHRHAMDPDRLVVVPNAVDTDHHHPRLRGPEAARLRDQLAVGPGPVWLFAGSGFARKGLDTALRALADAGCADAELWVAGGDEPQPWRRLADQLGLKDRVRFLGLRSDLASVYAAADGLLLPTRYDAFANVCLEAAATGLPVVTSGANGAAEVLGRGALVVPDAEDVAGFAVALGRLAEAPERVRLGGLARQAAEVCTWERHLDALRALYARVPLRPGR
jgi:UDP-glucose:(heptosyl)LPS alpha-1,3-glucosyltransferase